MIAGFCFQYLVAVNSTPGRNILHDAGVGTDDFQPVADFQLFDLVLGAYDGQRTKQASGIEGFYSHFRYTILWACFHPLTA